MRIVHKGEKKARKKVKRKPVIIEPAPGRLQEEEDETISADNNAVQATHPPSPLISIVNIVTKNEELDYSSSSFDLEAEEAAFMETVEVSVSEIVIGEMDASLKYRLYRTFKDRERSEIVQLISNGILNVEDLISVVVNAEKASLKTSELIELILDSFQR